MTYVKKVAIAGLVVFIFAAIVPSFSCAQRYRKHHDLNVSLCLVTDATEFFTTWAREKQKVCERETVVTGAGDILVLMPFSGGSYDGGYRHNILADVDVLHPDGSVFMSIKGIVLSQEIADTDGALRMPSESTSFEIPADAPHGEWKVIASIKDTDNSTPIMLERLVTVK